MARALQFSIGICPFFDGHLTGKIFGFEIFDHVLTAYPMRPILIFIRGNHRNHKTETATGWAVGKFVIFLVEYHLNELPSGRDSVTVLSGFGWVSGGVGKSTSSTRKNPWSPVSDIDWLVRLV